MQRNFCLRLLLIVVFADLNDPADAATVGTVKICKEGTAEEYGDAKWWAQEVVVPAGMVFVDIGMNGDKTAPPIKLRVITLQTATLGGSNKCKVVSAAIANKTERFGANFGTAHVGPLFNSISPNDDRVLTVEGQSTTEGKLAGRKMAPYDGDLPMVEMTIQTQLR